MKVEVDALEAKAEEQRKRKQDLKVATSSICENPRVSKLEERASAVEEVLENCLKKLKRWENLLNDLGDKEVSGGLLEGGHRGLLHTAMSMVPSEGQKVSNVDAPTGTEKDRIPREDRYPISKRISAEQNSI